MISFWVQEPYWSYLLSWEKTIECRLKKGKFSLLQVGDFLQHEESGAIFKVEKLTSYPSFYEMFKSEELKRVLPDVSETEHGVAVYRQFYSLEQEKEFWVIAIELERVGKSDF